MVKGRVGDDPLAPQPPIYANYAASDRDLLEIEDFVLEHVLPVYANRTRMPPLYKK